MARDDFSFVHTKWMEDRGFSLLEVALGVAIMGTAFAALAPVFVQVTSLLAEAGVETRAVAAALTRVEQLHALPFEYDAETKALVSDHTSNLAYWPPDDSGTGIRPLGATSLVDDTDGFVDSVDGDGAAQREGSPETLLVRRWSLAPLSLVSADEGRLMQALARSGAREARDGPRGSFGRRGGDVWLFAIPARAWR